MGGEGESPKERERREVNRSSLVGWLPAQGSERTSRTAERRQATDTTRQNTTRQVRAKRGTDVHALGWRDRLAADWEGSTRRGSRTVGRWVGSSTNPPCNLPKATSHNTYLQQAVHCNIRRPTVGAPWASASRLVTRGWGKLPSARLRRSSQFRYVPFGPVGRPLVLGGQGAGAVPGSQRGGRDA